MDASCWQVEDIACVHFMLGQCFEYGTVGHFASILFGSKCLFETSIDIGVGLCVDHVPHLALSSLAMHTVCHSIIGVHLYAQVIVGIDEFY